MSNRFFIRCLTVLFGLLALAIVFWALVPLFVSTSFVRSTLEREITQMTGVTVTVGEPAAIQLLPSPFAVLGDVTIAGSDPDAPPLAHVEAIGMELTFASIFTGRLNFNTIHFINPDITIRQDQEQSLASLLPLRSISNAVALTKRQRAEQSAALAGTDAVSTGAPPLVFPQWLNTKFGDIQISNGTIHIVRRDEKELLVDVLKLEQLNGQVRWPNMTDPIAIDAKLKVDGEALTFDLNSDRPLDLLAGEPGDIDVSITSDIISTSFKGIVAHGLNRFAKGEFSAKTPSFGRLIKWARQPIGAGRTIEALEMASNLTLQANKLRFDEISIDVTGSKGAGVLEFARVADQPPTMIGTLDFDVLDIKEFLGAFLPMPSRLGGDRLINLGFMDQLQTDLRISAEKATFDTVQMLQVAATAQTTPDLAIFDIGDATVFGGSIQSRLQMDRTDDVPIGEITISGQGLTLAPDDLAMIGLPLLPSGKGDITVTIKAPAERWSSFWNRGIGSVKMRLSEGVLPGLDAATLSKAPTISGIVQLRDENQPTGRFDQLDITAQIADGVADLDQAVLSFGTMEVTLDGFLPLASSGIALTAVLGSPADDNVAERRFFVGGSWQQPYIFPIAPPPTVDGQ